MADAIDKEQLIACLVPGYETSATDYSEEPLMVAVGTPPQTFYVNTSIIATHSEYFKSATKGCWSEGRGSCMTIPHLDPKAFTIYLNWVHSREIFLVNEQAYIWKRYLDCYTLGDFFMDFDFKDALNDAAAVAYARVKREDGHKVLPMKKDVNALYTETPEGCTARKLVLHMFAAEPNGGHKFLNEDTAPALLHDLVLMGFQDGNVKIPSLLQAADGCKFHEHGEGECYRKRMVEARGGGLQYGVSTKAPF